jgi:hypothetical protein
VLFDLKVLRPSKRPPCGARKAVRSISIVVNQDIEELRSRKIAHGVQLCRSEGDDTIGGIMASGMARSQLACMHLGHTPRYSIQ